jgi:diguanylate cyclase (GGDEF)-like protein
MQNNKILKTEYLRIVSSDTRKTGRRLAILGLPLITIIAWGEFLIRQDQTALFFRLIALIALALFLLVTQVRPRTPSATLVGLHLISLSAIIIMICGITVSEFKNCVTSPVNIMASATSRLITTALIMYFFAAGARQYLHYLLAVPTIFLIVYTGIFQPLDWATFSFLINPVIVIIGILLYNSWETRKCMREFISKRRTEYQKTKLEIEINEHKQQTAELQSQAALDGLTNLYNRRVAFSYLEKHITAAQEQHTPLTVCFIDVDHLKKVNDTHGHAEGDNLLRTVARSLRENVRNSDYICRLGGDEFLVIFPACNLVTARFIIKTIRQELNVIHKIDFSFGFAAYDHGNKADANTLVETADRNMYKDKTAKQKKYSAP